MQSIAERRLGGGSGVPLGRLGLRLGVGEGGLEAVWEALEPHPGARRGAAKPAQPVVITGGVGFIGTNLAHRLALTQLSSLTCIVSSSSQCPSRSPLVLMPFFIRCLPTPEANL